MIGELLLLQERMLLVLDKLLVNDWILIFKVEFVMCFLSGFQKFEMLEIFRIKLL